MHDQHRQFHIVLPFLLLSAIALSQPLLLAQELPYEQYTTRDGLPTASEETQGFGLVGLRERARILNGTISFSSAPGEGTTVIVTMPRREVDRG